MRHILDSMAKTFAPIHPQGYPFLAIFGVATLILFLIWEPLGWIGLILTGWCAYFFRDPARATPVDPALIVSPADGRVSYVGLAMPPAELHLGNDPLTRISVFMSVFDCHVNRMPVGGTVSRIAYRPGKFFNADLDKASEDNERNGLVVETADGRRVGVVQIAGLIARRIVCFAREGDTLVGGERFGLIRFGSRLDVYLPEGVTALVGEGQTAIAGETVLATFASSGERRFRTQ